MSEEWNVRKWTEQMEINNGILDAISKAQDSIDLLHQRLMRLEAKKNEPQKEL